MNFKIFKVFCSVILAISTFSSFSQNIEVYSISGTLLDSSNRHPIEYASVAIYKLPDNNLITGTTTNQNGEFILNKLKPGKYILKLSFIGYKLKTFNTEIINSSVKIDKPIELINSSTNLNEVHIISNQDEKQITIEKTKINVSQNISSVTGSITEVLKNQPSITIDAENNVYIRGNKNILILIDGVPTTITNLNSIPASNIESIDVITNPDAKYDAEGTGGIINIISKRKNTSGFSGSASLNYGFNNRINGGFNLNYSKGIWDINISYNGKYEKSNIESNLTREFYEQNIFVEQKVISTQKNPTQSAALQLSVKPKKKQIISLGFKLVAPKLFNKQLISGVQVNDTLPEVFFNRMNDITFSRVTIESSLSYKKTFEKKRGEISIESSFSRTKGNRPAEYYIENELLQKSSGGGAPTISSLQFDYLKPIFKRGKIEVGVKAFTRWNNFNYYFYDFDTISNQWLLNKSFSNDLEHHEYIYSSYLMYSDSLFNRLYYKIGTRIEYNTSELVQYSSEERIYKDYIFPFPYLLLKLNIKKNQYLALSINRRITRPTYPQLNPFIAVIDKMTYETGNKNLNPEVLDKIEFLYSFIKEKFQLKTNLYFSTDKDFITQVSLFSAPDNLIITYVNGNRQNKTGSDLYVNYQINKIISINSSVSVFYTKSSGQYNEVSLATNNTAFTGNISTIIKPEIKTELQLFFNYNSPIALPQFNLSEIYYMDIALKSVFFNNKLSVSLTLTDVFNTSNWNISSDNLIYKLNNYNKTETRILWVGLTYNFNSYKSNKNQKSGNIENDGGVIKIGQ